MNKFRLNPIKDLLQLLLYYFKNVLLQIPIIFSKEMYEHNIDSSIEEIMS